MRFLQVCSVILSIICLFGYGVEAQRPMVTSNVNCAGEYLACLDFENSSNPAGMTTVSKRCKDKIRGLDVCKRHEAYDPSQLQGPAQYGQYGRK